MAMEARCASELTDTTIDTADSGASVISEADPERYMRCLRESGDLRSAERIQAPPPSFVTAGTTGDRRIENVLPVKIRNCRKTRRIWFHTTTGGRPMCVQPARTTAGSCP